MFGLSSLGTVHTAFALVALVCGYTMLLRFGRISAAGRLGWTYVGCTVVTCLTGFGIFMRGGFNIAHALGVLTLVVLGVALSAARSREAGGLAAYVETVGLTLTLFFHMIPGLTETFTRFPQGARLFTSPEDPALEKTVGLVFLLFVGVIAWQIRRIWKSHATLRRRGIA